jgi:membrane protease YdiL (CAAX protease family)
MVGFVPTSVELWEVLARGLGLPLESGLDLGRNIAFPVLAYLFFISLGKNQLTRAPLPAPRWSTWKISLLPIVIAFAFGLLKEGTALFENLWDPLNRSSVIWFVISVPVGEELLFRGWFYTLIERVSGKKWLTSTNPMPVAVWMSAMAFSIWHLQNWNFSGPQATLFQVGYTFFTGIWLGSLRWLTRSLWIPILAHLAINALAG